MHRSSGVVTWVPRLPTACSFLQEGRSSERPSSFALCLGLDLSVIRPVMQTLQLDSTRMRSKCYAEGLLPWCGIMTRNFHELVTREAAGDPWVERMFN